MENIVSKIIAPQTQEAFKTAAALRTAEQSITQRSELKRDFDAALKERLSKYDVIVLDTSVVNIRFSPDFAKAVEIFSIIASLFGKQNMESTSSLVDNHKISLREFRPQYIFILFAFIFIER